VTNILAGLNPTTVPVAGGKPKSNGFYALKFNKLTKTGPIAAALPSDLEALIWFDRNLVIGKGRNWFGERISQTKQKAHLLLSTLDMERDVIVSRQCYLSSYTFPAVYLAPALVQHVNSIESQGTKIKRQLFMESCLKTGELQNSAVLATGRRMLACLGDGMGCVRS
jgi:hypothetical protein